MKVRKKPIVVDAWPWPEIPYDCGATIFAHSQLIATPEGPMARDEGD